MSKRPQYFVDFDGQMFLDAVQKAVADAAQDVSKTSIVNSLTHGTRADLWGITDSFRRLSIQALRNPEKILESQWELLLDNLSVWKSIGQTDAAEAPSEVIPKSGADRRFRDPEWETNPIYAFMRTAYFSAASNFMKLAANSSELDPKDAHKVMFYTRLFVEAICPANFAFSNPEVVRATMEQGGANLVQGLTNFLRDIDPETGHLHPKMVEDAAFTLGVSVASSAGSVVFQNALMQLIQYSPSTAKVYRRPLLIVPPWINKFYVLDLQERNSFIRWAVSQGHTVFVISWVNPAADLRETDFADYMKLGPLAALTAIEDATGEKTVNAIGYCLGGTLLGATLAYLASRDEEPIHSATFFTTLLDFSDPGDLGVFVDDPQVQSLEEKMETRGFLDGKEMATTFNLLRASDLIWSFVINNYLLGKTPAPFDLLYWNADSTRLPAKMHSTYLRKMYLENALREPGGLVLDGEPIDLRKIEVPVCFVSAQEDHIAPWKGTFLGAQLTSGPVEFILGRAGHIAGIINPPGPKAYGHFLGDDPTTTDADSWFAGAVFHPESWWLAWDKWVAPKGGEQVDARKPGDRGLPRIEAAPGTYVRVRS